MTLFRKFIRLFGFIDKGDDVLKIDGMFKTILENIAANGLADEPDPINTSAWNHEVAWERIDCDRNPDGSWAVVIRGTVKAPLDDEA